MFFVLVVSLFTTRIVLQSLGVVDYGIYNVVGGFVSMFAFLNTSLSNGIQRFYNYSMGQKQTEKLQDVYNVAFRIQVLLAVIIFVLLETVGMWYMYNKMVIPEERFMSAMWVFQLSVLSLVLVIMQIPYNAAIIAHERMDYFAYVSIYDVVARLAIAYLLYVTTYDRLIVYGILGLLTQLITFFLYFGYSLRHFKILKLLRNYDRTLFKPMLSFSGWNIFGTFAYMIKSQGLNMLLNIFFGPVINAARGVSNMILTAIQGFQTNITTAFRPQMVQSYAEGNTSRVISLFYSLSKVSYLLLSLLSIPLIIEINYVLHLWLGESVPEYTIPFTILVLVNMIVSSLNTPVSQVVHATGKMKIYQIGTSAVVCAILPISWIFLRIGCDATAVYWISLAMTVANQFVCNILLKRVFDYSLSDYLVKVIVPCMLFTLIAPILPYLITTTLEESFGRFLLSSVTSLISSLMCGYLFVLNRGEKAFAKDIINKKLKKA